MVTAQPWGHLRTVNTPVAIMSSRNVESEVTRIIQPGDWVRVDFIGNNWAAIFEKHGAHREESQALGYAYAPLLEPYSTYMQNVWETTLEQQNDSRVSLSEEFCKLDYHYNQNAVLTIVPQLSRIREPHVDDLPDMLRRRTIRVLTTYAPSTYFISYGQSYGFEYRLLKDYEAHLNRRPVYGKLPTVIEFIPIPENLLISSLNAGIGDIVAAGTRITPERISEADFTIPYLGSVSEVLVSHAKASPINRIDDLSNRRIHVQPGWESSKTLRRINARLLVRNLPPLQIIETNTILSSEDILELIDLGIIELSIAESHISHVWAETLPNITIHEFPEISQHTPIAWMVRKNNPDLKASLNRFLLNRRRGSHFGNIYYRQYFKQTKLINHPLAPTDHAKFSRYVPLFRKYGARYSFDWMLLAAVAYQESEMNHNRKSPSGAVGLMQVMPTTANDTSIKIRNINIPENNVHAGAKYLALLRDVYFADPAIRPHDRIGLILAAYNAGPNRIQQCRRLAAKLGYDPNKWFQNTEIAAKRLIGSETVRYVSNIEKYYLAYSLGHTMECLKAQHIEALKSGLKPGKSELSEFARR
jgi:membrane-bound lytic murein transglycosylase MltF